jgi:hypothetical protein
LKVFYKKDNFQQLTHLKINTLYGQYNQIVCQTSVFLEIIINYFKPNNLQNASKTVIF